MDKNKLFEEIRGLRRIVINTSPGGFSLSLRAKHMYCRMAGIKSIMQIADYSIARDDPNLVEVVKQLGEEANSPYSNLKIVEIPSNVEWQIESYDGSEWIAEKHRIWH